MSRREAERRLEQIEEVMRGYPADPADYYRYFVLTIVAINTGNPKEPPVWVGLPRIEGAGKTGAMLVAWRRMRRINADAYGIAEVAEDVRGQKRIFFYLVAYQDDERVLTQTKVYRFAYTPDGEARIVPLESDDWIMSDPLFLEPPERTYWSLFGELDSSYHEISEALENHRDRQGNRWFDVAIRYLAEQRKTLRGA